MINLKVQRALFPKEDGKGNKYIHIDRLDSSWKKNKQVFSSPTLTMKSQSFALFGLFLSSVFASPAKNDQPINGKGKGAPLLGKDNSIHLTYHEVYDLDSY